MSPDIDVAFFFFTAKLSYDINIATDKDSWLLIILEWNLKERRNKMKDENKLLEELEIDILELDDVEGAPATAASSGSGGSSTCGSTSCSSCSSSCA